MAVRRSRVFVDSIDGDICSILVGRKRIPVTLPLSMLPRGTSEGDWVIMTLQVSESLTRSSRSKAAALLKMIEKNTGCTV